MKKYRVFVWVHPRIGHGLLLQSESYVPLPSPLKTLHLLRHTYPSARPRYPWKAACAPRSQDAGPGPVRRRSRAGDEF
jgi:hypothetical protein